MQRTNSHVFGFCNSLLKIGRPALSHAIVASLCFLVTSGTLEAQSIWYCVSLSDLELHEAAERDGSIDQDMTASLTVLRRIQLDLRRLDLLCPTDQAERQEYWEEWRSNSSTDWHTECKLAVWANSRNRSAADIVAVVVQRTRNKQTSFLAPSGPVRILWERDVSAGRYSDVATRIVNSFVNARGRSIGSEGGRRSICPNVVSEG